MTPETGSQVSLNRKNSCGDFSQIFPYIPRCGLYWAYIPRFVQLRLIGVGILHKIKLDIVPTFASETKEKL